MSEKKFHLIPFLKFSARFLWEQYKRHKDAQATGIRNIKNVQLHPSASIDSTVDIVAEGCGKEEKVIFLGQNSWIRKYVELNSFNGSKIVVKDYSTIQDFCKLMGEIKIERYCLF